MLGLPDLSPTTPSTPLELPSLPLYTPLPVTGEHYYTDGSQLGPGQRLGAAYYMPEGQLGVKIDPGGGALSNTVPRAELVALMAAAQRSVGHRDTAPSFYTDSYTIMRQINGYIRDEEGYLLNNNRVVLREVAKLASKANKRGVIPKILKVPAHVGVEGNEAADQLAKRAAKGEVDFEEHIGSHYMQDLYWWGQTDADGNHSLINFGELTKRLDKQLSAQTRPGLVYENLWKDIHEDIDQQYDPGAVQMGRLHSKLQKYRVLYNWGMIMNNKLAQRWRLPGNQGGRCPLCGRPDSTGHLVGGCEAPELKSIRIAIHQRLVARIVKAIGKGSKGNYTILADGLTAHQRVPTPAVTALPEWVSEDRTTRPDIVLVEHHVGATLPKRCPRPKVTKLKQRLRFHAIEVGFIRDFEYDDAVTRKGAQHQGKRSENGPTKCVNALRVAGWKAQQSTILMGRGGTIYKHTEDTLHELGIDKRNAQQLLRKTQRDALNTLYSTVKLRRILERKRKPP
jgi:ribonuclease HI